MGKDKKPVATIEHRRTSRDLLPRQTRRVSRIIVFTHRVPLPFFYITKLDTLRPRQWTLKSLSRILSIQKFEHMSTVLSRL